MRKFLPYFLITILFAAFIWFFHPVGLTYRFNSNLIHDYLRSQDIEDPGSLIHDRIFVSDSDIYIASGYLYAKGSDPTSYNFQHPPLIKYLFGFSTLLTGNPYWVQIFFGLILLYLTCFLGEKIFKNVWIGFAASIFLLIDPVFGAMMDNALLDLGQTVFVFGYLISAFFYPANYILQGILLGFSAASKFWSTILIYIIIVNSYKIFFQKKKVDYRKLLLSFLIAAIVFCLTYIKAFIDAGGAFNVFAFLGKDLKFMLTHDSSKTLGGPLLLFVTGYFAPWWQMGISRAAEWSSLWPLGIIASIWLAIKTKIVKVNFFFYLLPFTYLLLTSTQSPFTRYFILILPFIYLSFANFLTKLYHSGHEPRV